jgi:hypothetical protein
MTITSITGADFIPANICGQWVNGAAPAGATTAAPPASGACTCLDGSTGGYGTGLEAGTCFKDGVDCATVASTSALAGPPARRLAFEPPPGQTLFVSITRVDEFGDENVAGGAGVSFVLIFLCICCCLICCCAALAMQQKSSGKRRFDDESDEGSGYESGGGGGDFNQAPVPPHVAAEFLAAARAEYCEGHDGALGDLFTTFDNGEPERLEPFEAQIAAAGGPNQAAQVLAEIALQWSGGRRDHE